MFEEDELVMFNEEFRVLKEVNSTGIATFKDENNNRFALKGHLEKVKVEDFLKFLNDLPFNADNHAVFEMSIKKMLKMFNLIEDYSEFKIGNHVSFNGEYYKITNIKLSHGKETMK